MNVSLAPEVIFYIGNFPVTNTVFTAVFLIIILAIIIFITKAKLKYRKPSRWQIGLELITLALFNLVKDITGKTLAKEVFAFVVSFFVIIVVFNLFALTPIVPVISIEETHTVEVEELAKTDESHTETSTDYKATAEEVKESNFSECLASKHCYLTTEGTVEFHESKHLFRAPTSDLSFGIALAIISVAITNLIGFRKMKLAYLKKYINFDGPIEFFVGVLEIISEIGKIISFSFRLFGNIFAGEILLIVITFITLGLATLPFYMLEIFVGLIQGFVFFMLTTVFINLAVTSHEH